MISSNLDTLSRPSLCNEYHCIKRQSRRNARLEAKRQLLIVSWLVKDPLERTRGNMRIQYVLKFGCSFSHFLTSDADDDGDRCRFCYRRCLWPLCQDLKTISRRRIISLRSFQHLSTSTCCGNHPPALFQHIRRRRGGRSLSAPAQDGPHPGLVGVSGLDSGRHPLPNLWEGWDQHNRQRLRPASRLPDGGRPARCLFAPAASQHRPESGKDDDGATAGAEGAG